MASSTHSNKRQQYMPMVHALIMLVIMFAVGSIEPVGSLTPLGIRLLGIFAAALYGWTTCGLLWPSLFVILSLAFSGLYEDLSQYLPASFGHETMVFVIFLFVFTEVINEVGLIDYIANKMISFKFLNNRPWLFTFVFLLASYICAAFINFFAALLVFWEMAYVVFKRFNFKPFEKYPTLLLIGVTISSTIGGCVMPYKPVPLLTLGAYSQLSGQSVDFLSYIMFSLPMTLLVMVFFVLVCRFVLRPELGDLKKINIDFVDQNALVLHARQKVATLFLFVFIFMMIAPSLLPADFFLTIFIDKLGIAGCVMLLIIIMMLLPVEGKPMLDFKKMAAQGINWDVYLAFCFIIPFAAVFTSDVTGVKDFVLEFLQPILSTLSPVGFIVVAMFLAVVLTNLANNMVISIVFATLIFTIGSDMGLEIMPLIAILLVCTNFFFVTPAACPQAAMMFGLKEWCRTKDLYKYCAISAVLIFVMILVVGMLWAKIVF